MEGDIREVRAAAWLTHLGKARSSPLVTQPSEDGVFPSFLQLGKQRFRGEKWFSQSHSYQVAAGLQAPKPPVCPHQYPVVEPGDQGAPNCSHPPARTNLPFPQASLPLFPSSPPCYNQSVSTKMDTCPCYTPA